MRTLSLIKILAVPACLAIMSLTTASASQRDTSCGYGDMRDANQRCVGRMTALQCPPGQVSTPSGCRSRPRPCNGIRYDPNCDQPSPARDTGRRRCPPGQVLYLGTCTPKCSAGIANNCKS